MDDTKFGKYQLIAALGHGGMADVFLAVVHGPDGLGFSKLVVLKRLRPNLAEDEHFTAMLVDESRLAARLNHPNTVQTIEVGEHEGQYFITMEYLDGQPLNRITSRARQAKKPMSREHALTVIVDVLSGLHHAHELCDYDGTPLHVVHRDVTPQNIFVTYTGVPKIIDFGIAKAAGRASQTKEGVIKGKVSYMSPEQAAAKPVDRRTDVFAAGVILWESLTGRRFWDSADEIEILTKLISRDFDPSARRIAEDVPDELEAIVVKAMAPKPDDRFATAEEMSNAILAYLDGSKSRSTSRELGSFVSALFEDRRKQTRELIESQLAQLSHSHSVSLVAVPGARQSGASVTSGSSGSGSSAASSAVTNDSQGHTEVSVTLAVDELSAANAADAKKRSRSRSLGLLAGSALVALAGAAAVVMQRSRGTESTTGTSTISGFDAKMADADATPGLLPLRTTIRTSPPEATIMVDGAELTERPPSFEQDNARHKVSATAPSFAAKTLWLTFDHDDVQIVLEPLGGADTKPKTGGSPAESRRGAQAPSLPPATSTSTPSSPSHPSGSPMNKKPLELDQGNPWR